MNNDEILTQLNSDLHDLLKLYEHAQSLYSQTVEPMSWYQTRETRMHGLLITKRHEQRDRVKEQMAKIHLEIDRLCQLILL
jgi:hypothetical protein